MCIKVMKGDGQLKKGSPGEKAKWGGRAIRQGIITPLFNLKIVLSYY